MKELLLMLSICSASTVLAQSTGVSGETEAPEPTIGVFDHRTHAPHMPLPNDDDYAKKKMDWANEFPDEYERLNSWSANGKKHLIDKSEFDRMPEYKKGHIMAYPERYEIRGLSEATDRNQGIGALK